MGSKQKYAFERGCLMCEPCLASKVRTKCSKCRNIIDLEDIKLIVDGKEFHKKCFSCKKCSLQLETVYGNKEDDYYCEPCYLEMEAKHCANCTKVILGEGLRFGEETYHPECFNCSKCATPLTQGSFHAIKGRPVCGPCNELQFQETCSKCGETVTEGLKFGFSKWNREEYAEMRASGHLKTDGVNVKYMPEHGPLSVWCKTQMELAGL